MSSDILVLTKTPLDEAKAEMAVEAIYRATKSAIVTRNPSSERTFLVRFDPKKDTPDAILEAVRAAGFPASIAGG